MLTVTVASQVSVNVEAREPESDSGRYRNKKEQELLSSGIARDARDDAHDRRTTFRSYKR